MAVFDEVHRSAGGEMATAIKTGISQLASSIPSKKFSSNNTFLSVCNDVILYLSETPLIAYIVKSLLSVRIISYFVEYCSPHYLRLLIFIMESATFLSSIRPSEWCQFLFVVLGAGAIANDAAPKSFRDQLMCYGARQAAPGPSTATKKEDPSASSKDSTFDDDEVSGGLVIFRAILKYTGLLIPVPHGWFTHFYVMLTAANLFWAYQYITNGDIMKHVAQKELMPSVIYPHVLDSMASSPVPKAQILCVMGMLTFQGTRRLMECLFVQKQSPNSYMLVMHWVLTFFFYTCMSIGIWIEGASTILTPSTVSESLSLLTALRTTVVLPVFLASSYGQFHAHRHLASLVKYTLPTAGLFKYFVCPHYFCECVNYLCLAIMAAPEGAFFSKTMLCALFFTAANLGVTARSTRVWYESKFGEGCVKKRWNMIPVVF